jgi:hypothetical protein
VPTGAIGFYLTHCGSTLQHKSSQRAKKENPCLPTGQQKAGSLEFSDCVLPEAP